MRVVLVAWLLAAACAQTQPPPVAPPAAQPASQVPPELEARLARLEKMLAGREEALEFLDLAYGQQVEQQTKPRPGTVYGVDIEQNLRLGQVAGSPAALVTIVEAWDFACPHCYRASSVLKELLDEYPGKLRVVFKNMVVHPQQVMAAHLAGCAAAKQGKFKEFYWAFFERGYKEYQDRRDMSFLSEDHVYKIAGDLGLDVARLKSDMPSCRQVIEADEAELRKFKVNGTPAFFVNGEFIGGGIPKEAFKQFIDPKLAIAERSGVPGAEYYEKEIRGKGERSVERSTKRPAKRGP
ncbi:MAG TPA: thioredoxin domain-containing protein [Kofleriaceae bacterium]|nr:thioredoxin domain-containing protein [Kofleriaceae bacterium]